MVKSFDMERQKRKLPEEIIGSSESDLLSGFDELPEMVSKSTRGSKDAMGKTRAGFQGMYDLLITIAQIGYSEDADQLLFKAQTLFWEIAGENNNIEFESNKLFNLGRMHAVLEMASEISRMTIPHRVAEFVHNSRRAQDILGVLSEEKDITSREVADKLNLKTTRPVNKRMKLMKAFGLVGVRYQGRKFTFSLMPMGRAIAERYIQQDDPREK